MVTCESKIDADVKFHALNMAILALAMLGLFLLLLSIRAPNVSADPVPDIFGWYDVTSDTTWDSGEATWSGEIYIESGVTLTMRDCKVTLTDYYQNIYVWDYATWTTDNVSLRSSIQTYGWVGYYSSYSTVRFNNTYIENSYYQYIQGYDVQITNSTIANGYFGIYIETWNGNNWGQKGPLLKNNLIRGNDYGAYMYAWGANAQPVFEDNLFIANNWQALYLEQGSVIFNNNTVLMNSGTGLTLYQPSMLEFNGNSIQRNGGNGIELYYLNTETTIYDNVFSDNSGSDIYLYSSKLTSVNNVVGRVTCEQASELNVYWVVDVQVNWQDGSGPVKDATVEFFDDKAAGIVQATMTETDGWSRGIPVKEYCWNDKGKQMYTPYMINATMDDKKASIIVDISGNSQFSLALDNIPPVLQIESPVNKMLTNKNPIHVRGFTEKGATCTINMKSTLVDNQGWFEAFINYTTDGGHDIKVACQDVSKNMRSASRTIYTDTKAPTLSIDAPVEGFLTNNPNIEVIAKTDAGATAELNGRNVVVDNDGNIDRVVALEEGENSIVIKVWDKAGNTREVNVTVKLDTTPPNLFIQDPADGDSVTSQDIRVVGLTESGSLLKVNGMDVRYLGSSFQYSIRLKEGPNVITVEAWDSTGNHVSKTVTIILDRSMPTITILTPSDTLYTNQKVVLLQGRTDPWNTVTVNGDPVQVDINTGYFERSIVLKPGSNKLVAVATDANSNAVSKSVTVVQDNLPPTLTILTPENGTVTNQDSIVIGGLTEPGASLTINGLDVLVNAGRFSAYIPLDEGKNQIVVVATDKALNMKSAKVFIIRDSVEDLRVSYPYDGMTTYASIMQINGTVEPGSTVIINKNLKPAMDALGDFRAPVSLELGQNDISVTATDPLGNVKSVKMTVNREEPPPPPPTKKVYTGPAWTLSGPWTLIMILFLGLIVGAVVMGALYKTTKNRLERRTKTRIDELLMSGLQSKGLTIADLAPSTRDHGAALMAGYKGPPLHIEKGPIPAVPDIYATPQTAARVEMDPEVAAVEERVKNAGYQGLETSRARNSLKLAKFYMGKGETEKMHKYLEKAIVELEELGA
jgi:hypothetical protein